MKRRVLAGLWILPLVLLAGCGYSAGGQQSANDLFTYESTPDSPKTVIVRDWSTNQIFLNLDVAVGEKLVMQFHKNKNKKNDPNLPDTMHWRLMPLSQRGGSLNNAMPVPNKDRRMVDWYETGKAPVQATAGR